ncbi:MAG: hypothetical protein ACI4KN_05145, partial [Gemmiger sp.]
HYSLTTFSCQSVFCNIAGPDATSAGFSAQNSAGFCGLQAPAGVFILTLIRFILFKQPLFSAFPPGFPESLDFFEFEGKKPVLFAGAYHPSALRPQTLLDFFFCRAKHFSS